MNKYLGYEIIYFLLIIIVIPIFTVFGCQKRKSLEGIYTVYFTGVRVSENGSETAVQHNRSINIMKSTRYYIYCGFENSATNYNILSKEGKNISGYLPLSSLASPFASSVSGPYHLTGTWSIEKGKYHISGNYQGVFEHQTYDLDTTYTIYSESGSFIILPN